MSWQTKYPHLVPYTSVTITNKRLSASYTGPEYGSGSGGDWAHQLTNIACDVIGNKLKSLYKSGNYSKVNLNNIYLSTTGMGMTELRKGTPNKVIYTILI